MGAFGGRSQFGNCRQGSAVTGDVYSQTIAVGLFVL